MLREGLGVRTLHPDCNGVGVAATSVAANRSYSVRTAKSLSLASFLLFAAPASASEVVPVNSCVKVTCVSLTYRADPGERNVLTSTSGADRFSMILRDAGAVIRGCAPFEDGVLCSGIDGFQPGQLRAYLGDGDDQATGLGDFYGQDGNDGLAGDGQLSGGPGNDVLTGSGLLLDEDGDSPGHDVYTGGSELRYDSKRGSGVRVDLRPGQPSEDRIVNVAKIRGTREKDVLIGDRGPNELRGGGGDDLVQGLGGDDVLSGNRVDGGSGDDRLAGGNLGARLRCGPGNDTVAPAPRAVVGPDCEGVRISDDGPWRLRLHAAPRHLRSPILARLVCHGPECRQHPDRWRLKADGRVLGETTVTNGPTSLRLNATGRALLTRAPTRRVQAERRYKIQNYDAYEYDRFWVQLARP